VTSEVTLPDGAVLGSGLRSVYNRLVVVPSGHLASTDETERVYAMQELYAVLTSMLASLPGVVNPASPRSLAGPWMRHAEWLCEASRVGLQGAGFRSTQRSGDRPVPNQAILVIGDRVLPASESTGDVPARVREGTWALARRVGADVLGVSFLEQRGSWLFVEANATPELRGGGQPVADALVDLLLARGESS
jgi:hypothetical protein